MKSLRILFRKAAVFGVLALFAAAPSFATGPKAYVGLFKDNAIAVIDTATNALLTTIPIPTGPHGLVVTPNGSRVFASSDGDSKVSIIDTTTDTVMKTVEVGKSPHGLAITPDGTTVLAAVFGANVVAFIDAASGAVKGTVAVASPHNIAVSPDGRTAYVAAQGKGALALVVLDVGRMSRVGSVALDKMPRALGFSTDGTKLYFTLAGSDAVQVLDPSTNVVVRQIPVGASPHHPLFTADKALVVSQGPGSLYVIDPKTDAVQGTVKVGTLPHWIAVTGGGRYAYVTNEGSNDVTVVDLDSMSATQTIAVGNAPRKIVIQPSTGLADVRTPIQGFAFEDSITINAGQTVIWTNNDAVPHTVSSDNGSWSSGAIAAGKSFSHRFDAPGTFSYHCEIHPAMEAIVVVKAGS
jgi:YVTN family beta-propeller protein